MLRRSTPTARNRGWRRNWPAGDHHLALQLQRAFGGGADGGGTKVVEDSARASAGLSSRPGAVLLSLPVETHLSRMRRRLRQRYEGVDRDLDLGSDRRI